MLPRVMSRSAARGVAAMVIPPPGSTSRTVVTASAQAVPTGPTTASSPGAGPGGGHRSSPATSRSRAVPGGVSRIGVRVSGSGHGGQAPPAGGQMARSPVVMSRPAASGVAAIVTLPASTSRSSATASPQAVPAGPITASSPGTGPGEGHRSSPAVSRSRLNPLASPRSAPGARSIPGVMNVLAGISRAATLLPMASGVTNRGARLSGTSRMASSPTVPRGHGWVTNMTPTTGGVVERPNSSTSTTVTTTSVPAAPRRAARPVNIQTLMGVRPNSVRRKVITSIIVWTVPTV